MLAASLLTFSASSFADTMNYIYNDTTRMMREEYGQNVPVTFTITATAGPNGSISPSGTITVNRGVSQTFTMNTANGYRVKDVLADGVSVGAVLSYPFSYITTNHTINVTFTNTPLDPTSLVAQGVSTSQINIGWADNSTTETGYKVERKTGAGGAYSQIALLGANAVSYSDVGLSPNTSYCYRVRAYNGNGDSGYSNEACATIQTHTITISGGPNGNISPSGPIIILHGDIQSFVVTPGVGYHITSISGCGGTPVGVQPNNAVYTYATGPIIGNCTVTASFMINPPNAGFTFTVTPTSGEVPLKVQFTDSSTLNPTSWSWNFGDNSYSTEQNPVHVFETYGTGNYTVSLTATNAGGPGSVTKTISVVACSNTHSVKLSSSGAPYDSISTAYAAAIVGDRIQSQAIHFIGNLIIDKNIILDGGYDCTISQKIGNTTIKRTTNPAISIKAGSAIMDGIAIE